MSKYLFADTRVPTEQDNPSAMRHKERYIKCNQCKRVCRDMIGVEGHYQMWRTGDTAICIHCGQCANICPVGYITKVPEWQKVRKAIDDKDSIVIFSTPPSVRAALEEFFETEPGSFAQDKMVALLRALGADYVLGTNPSADLIIMKEVNELTCRIQSDNTPIPQLTSCRPAWAKFVEISYPEFKENLSTSKSPTGMQGPTIKTYSAKKQGPDPRRTVNVVATPRIAKKFETRREEMYDAGKEPGIPGVQDMDYAITTGGLAEWVKSGGIDFTGLKSERYDSPMGEASGAGVIFGNVGGMTEAAIRTVYAVLTGELVPENLLKLEAVCDMEGIREASLTINGIKLDIAVVYGTANARILLDKVKASEKFYQSIEVVICPGGCIGGGGQPKDILADGDEIRRKRISDFYRKDESMKLRFSHENPGITQVYDEFYKTSGSEKAERMLHTAYIDRSGDLNQQ